MRTLPHGLIASVQASGDEPLNQPEHLTAMALSCLNGGASGLRLSDPTVIRALREQCGSTFIVGLSKPEPLPPKPEDVVYITPAYVDMAAIANAGADMVAIDATCDRPHPQPLPDKVRLFRRDYPHLGLMADCATLNDALNAYQLGFDVVSTTLSGYTTHTVCKKQTAQPDFDLLSAIRQQCPLPVVLEGRVWTPEHVTEGFRRGACAVVVGSAISRPQHIVAYLGQGLNR